MRRLGFIGRKAIPSPYSSYYHIGGSIGTPVHVSALTQTDASFWLKQRLTSLGILMYLPDSTIIEKSKILYTPQCSTEAEWEAVRFGLEETLEQGATNICLENDNFSVVETLIDKAQRRTDYSYENYEKIKLLCKHAQYVGIRWIPRELNLADGVARNSSNIELERALRK
jgi:ribonuclease HI